jgi:alpha-D-xyloside xylohydrolase
MQVSRKVYLPAATKWYNFWTSEPTNGGQTIEAAAPIDIMPLYVRASSIIPMGPNVKYANQPTSAPMANSRSTRTKTTTTITKKATQPR